MTDAPYDPAARRDTPLALVLKDRIRRDGPISLAAYMRACLYDQDHGYYTRRAAIGRDGDFVTAPEISQAFGELIGLWAAVVWQQMGAPARINLVELGPGRGTLMKDALRAARLMPKFFDAVSVHLVETNKTLVNAQMAALTSVPRPLTWHATADEVPAGPAIVVGNEFLDTFPVDHWRFRADAAARAGLTASHETARRIELWQQRHVALDDSGALAFTWRDATSVEDAWFGRRFMPPLWPRLGARALSGETIETRAVEGGDYGAALWRIGEIDDTGADTKGAALLIDYGHPQSSTGDSLQALRAHKAEHPLTSPGEADLTAQVDFAELRAIVDHSVDDGDSASGPRRLWDGPVTQAEFLGRLGIMERASKLMSANPAKAAEIEMGIARLMAVPGMGDRFKVVGVRTPTLPPLPGF